jgi:two-component system cell cycle sensor histidine kinase/response regulator CckA
MRNGKILVMDDNADIRYIFTKMLNSIEYEVEVAGDGSEAIALFKNAIEVEKPFDAVIMDLKVAYGMGGDEAIKRMLEIDEKAKIILCSGSISDQIMIDYRMYGINAVLCKPFKKDDLKEVLKKVISG